MQGFRLPPGIVPTIEELKAKQNTALSILLTQTDPTPVFQVWTAFRELWMSLDDVSKGALLGHLAVLWQELDKHWTIRREAAPLLNQFINVGFQGIHRAIPRVFTPDIAPGPVPWYNGFAEMVRGFSIENAHQEALFDASLVQYEILYGPTVAAEADRLLGAQLGALALARQCRRSGLLAPEDALAHPGDPRAAAFFNTLARIVAVGAMVPKEAEPSALLGLLVPSAPVNPMDMLQLLGFWAARAPWLVRFLNRHVPAIAPHISRMPVPPPDSLPIHHGCDLYVLLAGARGTGTKNWLFASEAASANTANQLVLNSLDGSDVEQLRAQWLAGQALTSDEAMPSLDAQRAASHVLRLQCWDLPSGYLEGVYDKHALAAQVGSAQMARSDAALGREWIRLLHSQRPSAAILLLDLQTWLATKDPRQRASLCSPYLNAIDRVTSMLREFGGRPETYPWVFVFNNASWLSDAMYHPDTDERLRTEYIQALRGGAGHASEALVSVHADGPHNILREALCHPLALKSPAFAGRITEDISAMHEVLAFLTERGFRCVSFAYTSSNAAESGAWASLRETWSFLEWWLALSTLQGRQAFFKHRFSTEIAEHIASASPHGQLLSTMSERIKRVAGVMESQGGDQPATNVALLWNKLEALVGTQKITPEDFAILWQGSEHSASLAKSSTSHVAAIAELLLQELGVPNQALASFQNVLDEPDPSYLPMLGASLPTPEERALFVQVTAKPQPVSVADPDLSSMRPWHMAYTLALGSLSNSAILKDRAPDDLERRLMYENGSRNTVQFLLEANASPDDKIALVLALKNVAPSSWRSHLTFKRHEKNDAKFRVLHQVWRDVLIADIALLHLLRMTIRVAELVGGGGESAMFDERRRRIRGLLDAGGWNTSRLVDDLSTGDASLRRLVDLWKDFYRNFGPHRQKRREEICKSLKQEYDQLRKPMAAPSVHAGLTKEKAMELERGVYLAHHCIELLSRFPQSARKDTASDVDRASQTPELREFARKAEVLLRDYGARKARFMINEVAYTLEESQWLRGLGGHRELMGRDLLAHANASPDALTQNLSRGIDEILSRGELWQPRGS
jgi:hypothetical protein